MRIFTGAGTHPADKKPLTFGIELEFALATLRPRAKDPDPQDPRQANIYTEGDLLSAHKHIATTLTTAGFAAKAIAHRNEEAELSELWHVKSDASIRIPEHRRDAYEWKQIEVVSPAMYFNKDAVKLCGMVCWRLTQTYRMVVNESCGLHVHVGNGEYGFELGTLKNLMAFLWTYEPQIESLHAPHRIGHGWCQGLLRNSQLAMRLFLLDEVEKRRKGLKRILACKTKTEVCDKMVSVAQGIRDLAYDVQNLADGMQTHQKTIEWRQHEGTLDWESVEMWIRTCVGIVSFADEVDGSFLEQFLWDCLGKVSLDDKEGGVDVRALLKKVNLPVQADYYGDKADGRREAIEARRTKAEEEKKQEVMEEKARREGLRRRIVGD